MLRSGMFRCRTSATCMPDRAVEWLSQACDAQACVRPKLKLCICALVLGPSLMATRALQRMGIDPVVLQKLVNRRVSTAKELLSATQLELVEALDLSFEAVEQLVFHVCRSIAPAALTASELHAKATQSAGFLPTQLAALDLLLRGGIPVAGITELVGPAGVGKSQLCHMLAVSALLPQLQQQQTHTQAGCVMYIDTEKKFSSRRVVEMAKARWPEVFTSQEAITKLTEHVLVVNPDSSEALIGQIKALEATIIDYNVRLVLVDSIAALARAEFSRDKLIDRQQVLGQQAATLKLLAETFRIPVVVVNQVTAQMQGPTTHAFEASAGAIPTPAQGQLTAALGVMWAHAVNTRLVLETIADVRYIKVAKSPAAPMQAFAYKVTQSGLELIEGHVVPPQLQSSVLNMHVAHEISYEPEAMAV